MLRLPVGNPSSDLYINARPTLRTYDKQVRRIGWLASTVFHAGTLSAILSWTMLPAHQRAHMAGMRSVSSIQLTFSAPAIAGELEEFQELELVPDKELPTEVELAKIVPEIETPETVIVEKVFFKKASQKSEKPSKQPKPVKKQKTQSGTATVNSIASPAAVARNVGLDNTIPAKLVWNPLPIYPAEAVSQRIKGRVLLRLTISFQGYVSDASINVSSGHAMLDSAALAAVRQWHFEPARRDGEPIEWSALLPVRFRLD